MVELPETGNIVRYTQGTELITFEEQMPCDRNIVFISDLHFDFIDGKYNDDKAPDREKSFIKMVSSNHKGDIICLAGDFYNDFRKVLEFVKKLEEKEINGFFVLGNHDFWNNGTFGHEELIRMFDEETNGHIHFRFLKTGKKYYIGDLCFIGDTGWTSFKGENGYADIDNAFFNLPDVKAVMGFNPKEIQRFHRDWIKFANGVLRSEKRVIVMTHFPMINFAQEERDLWWSSETELVDSDNSWRIFGHTHHRMGFGKSDNNISSQRGYGYSEKRKISESDLGYLVKLASSQELATSDYEAIAKFYTPKVVKDPVKERALVCDVEKRGYRRAAANKHNLAALASDPKKYLKRVKETLRSYERNEYIGYALSKVLSPSVMSSVSASIALLESGYTGNIRAFMTAAIITGYVWNQMPGLISEMRPLDDYDVMRFYMLLTAMKEHDINMESIKTIRAYKKDRLQFNNMNIPLPAVNGKVLSREVIVNALRPAADQGLVAIPHISESTGKEKTYSQNDNVNVKPKRRKFRRWKFSKRAEPMRPIYHLHIRSNDVGQNMRFEASDGIGCIITKDVKMLTENINLIKTAAELGDTEAQFNLAMIYGTKGAHWNPTDSERWFQTSAENGNVFAQYAKGTACSRGIPTDYAEAMKWFRLAAEQDCMLAMFDIGTIYENGLGVERDFKEAIKWYALAAEHGDREAEDIMKELCEEEAHHSNVRIVGTIQAVANDDKQFNDAFNSAGGWFILTQYEEVADYTGDREELIDRMFVKGFDSKRSGTQIRVSALLRLIKNNKGREALERIRDSDAINAKHPDAKKMASEIIARRF